MALALISDIHGNLPALQAVLADARRRGVSRFLNLGDILYGPLWPRQTWELLQTLEVIGTVRGNDDRIIYAGGDPAASLSLAYVLDELPAAAVGWLRDLPFSLDLPELGLQAFHASPQGDELYLCEDIRQGGPWLRPEAELLADLEGFHAPLIAFGHSHYPRALQLPDGRRLINPGSVGLPAYWAGGALPHRMETGSPEARYAIVEPAGAVQLIAVPYDHGAAIAQARRNGRPDWARWLETGRAQS
jgi:predicted phosphodiesterase